MNAQYVGQFVQRLTTIKGESHGQFTFTHRKA